MKRDLRFGISLNNRASVFLDNYPPPEMVRLAEAAENLGIDSVWVGDSLVDSPRYEPLTILGAVAARTSRVRLGGSIIQPHFRNPVILALSWATLDRLSGGRTILIFGIGGGTPQGVVKEAQIVGADVRKRGKAIEENVKILRTLWRGEALQHDGEIYKFDGVKIGYRPLQTPPPIWIAAGVWVPRMQGDIVLSATPGYTMKKKEGGEAGAFSGAFDRVARLGDGWFTIMIHPEEFREKSELISSLARECGRDPSGIVRAVECWFNLNENRERARTEVAKMIEGYFGNPVHPETVERWSIYGTEQECVRKIEEFRSAGAHEVKLIMGSRDQFAMLQRFGKTILPSF
jgi:alkanesulfonate monooxygenase SsuD/methylene tetrahydromethanopterin reductase-like flavin-dependent oxidoreductase (luciferase family)